MGISAAAGLGAWLVDSGKRNQRQTLEKQRNALNVSIASLWLHARLGALKD
jgi:hypothetical protein